MFFRLPILFFKFRYIDFIVNLIITSFLAHILFSNKNNKYKFFTNYLIMLTTLSKLLFESLKVPITNY